jgi:hypothetical protein
MSVTRRGAGCGGFVRGRRAGTEHRFKPRPTEPAPGTAVELSPPGTQEQTCNAPRAERRRIGGPW